MFVGANRQFQLGLRVKGERSTSLIISFGFVRET